MTITDLELDQIEQRAAWSVTGTRDAIPRLTDEIRRLRTQPTTPAGRRLVERARAQHHRALTLAAELDARRAAAERAERLARLESADPDTLPVVDRLWLATQHMSAAIEASPLLRTIRDLHPAVMEGAWR